MMNRQVGREGCESDGSISDGLCVVHGLGHGRSDIADVQRDHRSSPIKGAGGFRDYAEMSTLSRTARRWRTHGSMRRRITTRSDHQDRATAGRRRAPFQQPGRFWVAPVDWSPRTSGGASCREGRTTDIGITLADGSYRTLKAATGGTTRIFISPDGSLMAYDLLEGDNGGARDVFVIRTDGSRVVKVAPHRGYERVMGWSPDGTSLLFASDRAGSMGLWSVSFTNGQPGQTPTLLKADLGHVVATLGVTRSGALLYGVRTGAATIATASIDLESGKLLSAPTLPFENYCQS